MINKVNAKGPKYLCAVGEHGEYELATEVLTILGNNEYVIEYTEVSTEEVYFRLLFKYKNTYQVRYTGKSHEPCIAYLDRIPQNASVISWQDIIQTYQKAYEGKCKLYKYPIDKIATYTLKDFV